MLEKGPFWHVALERTGTVLLASQEPPKREILTFPQLILCKGSQVSVWRTIFSSNSRNDMEEISSHLLFLEDIN